MTQKIEISEKEKKVIQDYLDGNVDPYTATDEEQEVLMAVTSKAQDLLIETDDEVEDDLIKWYWGKYQAQENVTAE